MFHVQMTILCAIFASISTRCPLIQDIGYKINDTMIKLYGNRIRNGYPPDYPTYLKSSKGLHTCAQVWSKGNPIQALSCQGVLFILYTDF